MDQLNAFRMTVEDVFQLSFGRTVFVGIIDGETELIKSCQCDLIVAGEKKGTVYIEGEMITENRSNIVKRSLSTAENVELSQEDKKHCALVFRGTDRP